MIYIYTYICIHAHIHTHIYTYTAALSIVKHKHIYVMYDISLYTYAYMYIHTHAHIYIYRGSFSSHVSIKRYVYVHHILEFLKRHLTTKSTPKQDRKDDFWEIHGICTAVPSILDPLLQKWSGSYAESTSTWKSSRFLESPKFHVRISYIYTKESLF